MSDMGFCVDGWAAKLHAHFARLQRLERLFVFGEGIVDSNRVGSHGGAGN